MAWLWVVLVVVVLGLTAAVAVGRGGALERAYPDRRDVRLPAGRPVIAEDLEDVEFSVVFRGYRMDEVDAVLERLANELAARDARLAELEPPAARMGPGHRGEGVAATGGPTEAAGPQSSALGRAVGPRFDPVERYQGAATPYAEDPFAPPTHAADPTHDDASQLPPLRPGRPHASAPYDQHQDEVAGHPAPRSRPHPGAGDP